MAKLIYDFDEKFISKKVYAEDENGKREYFPFFAIKLSNVHRQLELKCWKSQREMADYFMRHPVTDETDTPKDGDK